MSQENNFIPNQESYKPLSSFRLFVKSNFPFIEATYEALDNYGLYCKIVEYLNNVIANENTVESNVSALYNAFVSLNTYVSDYFDNLDVQDEINNKLDELVQDGTIERMVNDGKTIFIGDSYGLGTTNTSETIPSWIDYLIEKMHLLSGEYHRFAEGGAGFVSQGTEGHTFRTLLQANINSITNKDIVKKVICCGGFNDRNVNSQSAIQNFVNYCKQQFPNCKVYIGMIGATKEQSTTGNTYRYNLYNVCLASYKRCTLYGAIYLSGVENALKDYTYLSNDNQHPNADGYKSIASFIYNALYSGKNDFYSMQNAGTIELPSNATGGTLNTNTQRMGEMTSIQIAGNITFNPTNLSNAHDLTLGQFSDPYFRFSNHMTLLIPCYFTLASDSQTLYRAGFIHITGGSTNNCHLLFDDTTLTGMHTLTIITAGITIPTNIS